MSFRSLATSIQSQKLLDHLRYLGRALCDISEPEFREIKAQFALFRLKITTLV